jgi:hypothetical protein
VDHDKATKLEGTPQRSLPCGSGEKDQANRYSPATHFFLRWDKQELYLFTREKRFSEERRELKMKM